ncbi:MAG: hypothetical protein EBU46_07770 [Nitrosomonadaceae bacterium]|nr:hypothetical protein [Nitrosomonadaceae bacterium]
MIEGAYLAGRSASQQHILEERRITLPEGSIPLDKMIYVAAFQGGIEQFVTPLRSKSDQPIDQFISKRISTPKQLNSELFSKLMALKPKGDKDNSWMALSFVHDLIVAMENNASVINISGVPSIAEVKKYFAPEIALPICNILSALKAIDELLPAPSQVVSRDGIDRFKELLESDVYSHYASAHREMDFSTNTTAIAEVRSRGADLLKAGKGALRGHRVSMNVLSVVPKIVDAAFGKLPGTLAQVAGDLATKFFEDRKNIVIYQFGDWANEYTHASILHATQNVSDRGES